MTRQLARCCAESAEVWRECWTLITHGFSLKLAFPVAPWWVPTTMPNSQFFDIFLFAVVAGVILFRLGEGERVVSVERIPEGQEIEGEGGVEPQV